MVPYDTLLRDFPRNSSNRVAVPDDPRPATFADGLAAMRVIDAIRRSGS